MERDKRERQISGLVHANEKNKGSLNLCYKDVKTPSFSLLQCNKYKKKSRKAGHLKQFP